MYSANFILSRFILCAVLFYLCCNTLFVFATTENTQERSSISDTKDSNAASKLELAGSDSFDYDINNKIRKAKSNFSVGIGANISKINEPNRAYNINISVLMGYNQFFYKTFGFRAYATLDYTIERLYAAGGIDILWDFVQTEPFGLGIILGSSFGYANIFSGQDGYLSQFHVGMSMNFDGGKSRIEGLVRIPYHKLDTGTRHIDTGFTYVIMYSYSF